MKQIRNLAVICAQRNDVLMQIYGARVSVYVGEGSERECVCLDWNNDDVILDLIRDLNFGKYAPDKMELRLQQRYFDTMTALPDCPLWCGGKGKITE